MQRAVALGFLLRRDHRFEEFGFRLGMALVRPGAASGVVRSHPHDLTAAICNDFGYEAFVLKGREKLPALPAIAALGQNSTYNTHLITRNVLFLPQ